MPTRHFRAGVGTVIYNEHNEIAIFKRSQPPVGAWELQQGGIDLEETPEETLWRELHEEIGLLRDDIEMVTSMPGWTLYQSPRSLEDTTIPMLGQAHRWFFLKLKTDKEINLSDALQDEASEFRWTNFEELLSLAGDHKKHVYEEVHRHFLAHIAPKK